MYELHLALLLSNAETRHGVHNRLDGCIVLGVYNCVGSIIRPKSIFDALYERIRKSLSRGHEVKLSIV